MAEYAPRFAPSFAASFAGQQLTTAGVWQLFALTAPSNSMVEIHEISLSEYSTLAVAMGVQVYRGTTTTASTGTVLSNVMRLGYTSPSPPTAGSSVTGPTTTPASTASASLLQAGSIDPLSGRFVWRPDLYDRPLIHTSQRLHVTVTTPSTSAPLISGTITYSEVGTRPI